MARSIRPNSLGCFLGLILLFHAMPSSAAADFTVKLIDKAPPKDVADSVRATLQSKAVQLLEGEKPAFEFWFRNEIPLKSKAESPTKALEAIGETTLCGVISVQTEARDYKDNEIAPGLYTARFALQPQDGDHLGTSEFLYYLVLIPAKDDTQINGISAYKPMVKASGKATASGHPVVLSLRPASSDDGESPKLNEPLSNHKSIRLRVPAKAPGANETGSVIFELVYYGKGKT